MRYINNEKGITLLESIISTLIIASASALFLAGYLTFTYQKDVQKNDILMVNLATEALESNRNKLLTDQIALIPFTEEVTKEIGMNTYTITVNIENYTQTSNPDWVTGVINTLTVSINDGKRTEVLETHVFKE